MATDAEEGINSFEKKSDKADDCIEELRKEIEKLKSRLEEERKKLNDVPCMTFIYIYNYLAIRI